MVAASGESTTSNASAPTATQTPATTAAAGRDAWKRVVPGGDCQCSDGSEFRFCFREANPRKGRALLRGRRRLLLGEDVRTGKRPLRTTISEGTTGKGCIFDFTGERNPFADYTVVYGPYRTGDVHIGNTTTKYPPGITVHTRATSTAPPLSTTRPPHFPTRPTSW